VINFPHVRIEPIDPGKPMVTGNIRVVFQGIEIPTTYFKVEGPMNQPVEITLTFFANVEFKTRMDE